MELFNFESLTLYKTYKKLLNNKWDVCLYYTIEKRQKETAYRWHFGFPEKIIKPFLPLLETTPYWGEQHWKEIDEFYLYWLTSVTEKPEPEIDRLERMLKGFYIPAYNKCFFLCRNRVYKKGSYALTVKWNMRWNEAQLF